jgi:hypothetical protein
VVFNSTFWSIDDVLSINNNQFHTYVDSIYTNELEIKDTTECSTSALYLDRLLKLDTNCKLTIQIYDKRDDLNVSIVNFLTYMYVAISYLLLIWRIIVGFDRSRENHVYTIHSQ